MTYIALTKMTCKRLL